MLNAVVGTHLSCTDRGSGDIAGETSVELPGWMRSSFMAA